LRERILTAGAGERLLLIGNEAIVRGALEAGVKVATTYPGTPASEIGDTFCALASRAGIAFEYSINEKAAFEVAYGACLGGVRALSSMKHLGLNVAGDPFVTSAYVGTVGGLVVVSAGEPGCHTSPNEQDHRYFARMAYVPVFDPSDPQEALDMTRAAFDLSERWKLPILLRPTTRVSHTQGIVTVGAVQRDRPPIPFVRDPSRFLPVPRTAKVLRDWLIRRAQEAAHDDDVRRFNRVEGSGTDLAIVTSGVSACYVADAVAALGLRERTRILRLGIPYPLDEAQVAEALAGARGVLVVEELEPFIEEIVKKTLFDRGVNVPVRGKASGDVPLAGELTPAIVREAVRAASSGAARKPAGGAAPPPPRGRPGRDAPTARASWP
jgi:indolepyruvate ferredoxin oxidoreductase alpha subunit